jgi:hypothetical protein
MRPHRLVGAVFALASCTRAAESPIAPLPPPKHADAFHVTIAPPKQGEIAQDDWHMTVNARTTRDGRSQTEDVTMDATWTTEALEVDGGVLSKARVAFGTVRVDATSPAHTRLDVPLSNKTYVATAYGGKLAFTDGHGNQVSADDRELLSNYLLDIGRVEPLRVKLDGKDLTKGVGVPIAGGDLFTESHLGLVIPPGDMSATLTLVDLDHDRATFDIATKVDTEVKRLHTSVIGDQIVTVDLSRHHVIDVVTSTSTKMTGTDHGHAVAMDASMQLHHSTAYR